MKSIQELTTIGLKINIAVTEIAQAIEGTGLTEEELKEFGKYLSEQDALMPLLHPTEYKNGGAEALVLVSKRVDALQKIFPLLPKPTPWTEEDDQEMCNECRNVDIQDQKVVCRGSEEWRRRHGCLDKEIEWINPSDIHLLLHCPVKKGDVITVKTDGTVILNQEVQTEDRMELM